jgi:beta-galactosidase
MKTTKLTIFTFLFSLAITTLLRAQTIPETTSFNDDWFFILDDDSSYITQNYDHSTWRELDLPHDWSIEGEYDESNAMGATCGYLPAGVGYYRKTIEVPDEWKGNVVKIAFDGVFMNSTVWANGYELGTRPYGWISFSYDISEIVDTADFITFAVRVDNESQPSARWYTGSGIYADTWIKVMNPTHIEREGGLFIRTSGNNVYIDTEVNNESENVASLVVKTTIVDEDGQEITSTENSLEVASGAQDSAVSQQLEISSANLWSPDSPYLYTAQSEIWQDDELLDEVETSFGIRDIEWIPETGMWLNGENIKLQGVCNHQDAGPLGAAVPDKILRYRIQQLKNMGCNAIRTSHNPQTPKFYEMCDELGMIVLDEIFDGWKQKATNDYGARFFDDWWTTDLTAWVKRDRNHPSVFLYSLGNETSGTVGAELVALCHELDSTRQVTSGHSEIDDMDIVGVNGASERDGYLEALDYDKVIIGTENTHTWQVRSYYRTQTWYRDGESTTGLVPTEDLTDYEIFYNDWILSDDRSNTKQVFNSSYDNAYVRRNSRGSIEQIRDTPNFAGSFRWTGFDYIGEASYVHGGWPFKAFSGGAIDLANFEKDLYYLYQSQWTDEPMVHILPHWTHPMMPDTVEVPVWVYSNCDEVELFFNDESLGMLTPGTTKDDMQCQWMVLWQQGELKAVGYNDGVEVTEETVTSANYPTQNKLSIDGEELSDEGKDIVQVRVETCDSLGNFYPHGENRTYFHVIGPASIRALGNGSPIDDEPHYGVNNRIAFYGLTRAFIESDGDEGDIQILAGAILGEKKQITSDRVTIDTKILTLRGSDITPEIKVYYTTDGSDPTTSSTLYEESFSVSLGTTVQALVTLDGEEIFTMSERFAEDEGFVWNDIEDGVIPNDVNSLQAEDAEFEGATISTSGSDYNGTGFLNFGQYSNGYVQWYVENDDDAKTEILNIRYSCNAGNGVGRTINIIVNDIEIETEYILPNTGSWGSDWDTVSVEISLEGGANTIKLQNPGSGGAYLDEISFGKDDDNTSITGISTNLEISILPVPVKNELEITETENPSWNIFNTSGVKLLTGTGNSINVSDLDNAIYFIKICDDSGFCVTKKFIKTED